MSLLSPPARQSFGASICFKVHCRNEPRQDSPKPFPQGWGPTRSQGRKDGRGEEREGDGAKNLRDESSKRSWARERNSSSAPGRSRAFIRRARCQSHPLRKCAASLRGPPRPENGSRWAVERPRNRKRPSAGSRWRSRLRPRQASRKDGVCHQGHMATLGD